VNIIPFKKYQKEIFLVSFLAIAILSFLIVKPFLAAVILGAVIAYVFYPVFLWVKKGIKNPQISAVLTLLIITLIFTLPLVFILNSMIGEISDFYIKTGENMHAKEIKDISTILTEKCMDGHDTIRCRVNQHIVSLISDGYMQVSFREFISDIYMKLIGSAPSLLLSIPAMILYVLIVVFVIFYLFLDWEMILKEIDFVLPFREDMKKAFAKQIRDIIHATIYGNIVVVMMQGAIAAVAFFVFDTTKAPIFWGVITMIAGLVPFVGTALVWLPLGTMQVINGVLQGSNSIIWRGAGMMLVGLFIISTIDNVIKPRMIGRRAMIHPLLVLLGVLGGINFFGFIGFILGPLIIAILVTLVRLYKKEKNEIIS